MQASSLDIPRGEITALVGPIGSGTSTFLRTLNRLNEVHTRTRTTGQVLLDGRDIYDRTYPLLELRRRVGMLFPEPNPFARTIYENVACAPRLAGVRERAELDARVEHCLRAVGLWTELSSRLRHGALDLPDAQQQRLCLARVLAADPEVVLLDEPCAVLDPVAARELEDLLLGLSAQYTLVLATHDRYQAARLSERAAFFLQGELVETARTEDLFQRPRDSRTEAFLSGRYG